ncbi:MAG: DRTGG domain-containing protein [Bacteroidales bacterium]|jgi:serine kinase of HPr protein (carbohydrate metabolism regulator)|nr:DRTGG domain-containing protein [Bacteroidales bacterium]NCU34778.1 serine kinase [Candidatus Falkowbacteria bacterium]MDD2631300.1 DRTGG domain-containing protein [Bacteroidales bacterium]MDD3527684.1 DRTGG domain-containing protein [Bacteroidales bacterium]MDD4176641.1 DRTGG domain-containing protein [Bacteroidales bacterium]
MTVKDLIQALELKVFSGEQGLENEIQGGYTSDLLSDVMGHCNQNDVWVTLQTHRNIMAIASLRDLAAIVIVKDLEPEPEAINKSNQENIPILGTALGAFEISGKIYEFLKKKV